MAVTLTPGSSQGSLNGTSAVTIIPAPAANTTRLIRQISIVNKDTVTHTIRTRKTVAGTPFEFDNSVDTQALNGKFQPIAWDGITQLTATDQSITAIMDEVMTTTNPTYVVSWLDRLTS